MLLKIYLILQCNLFCIAQLSSTEKTYTQDELFADLELDAKRDQKVDEPNEIITTARPTQSRTPAVARDIVLETISNSVVEPKNPLLRPKMTTATIEGRPTQSRDQNFYSSQYPVPKYRPNSNTPDLRNFNQNHANIADFFKAQHEQGFQRALSDFERSVREQWNDQSITNIQGPYYREFKFSSNPTGMRGWTYDSNNGFKQFSGSMPFGLQQGLPYGFNQNDFGADMNGFPFEQSQGFTRSSQHSSFMI